MSRFDWGVLFFVVAGILLVILSGSQPNVRDLCAEAGGITVEVKGQLQCYAFDLRERIIIEGEK